MRTASSPSCAGPAGSSGSGRKATSTGRRAAPWSTCASTHWWLDPTDLRTAVDAKLSITRHRRWRPELWRTNLQEIRELYEATMATWVNPAVLPPFDDLVQDVTRRLRELMLD
jgi:hypothetical protein